MLSRMTTKTAVGALDWGQEVGSRRGSQRGGGTCPQGALKVMESNLFYSKIRRH